MKSLLGGLHVLGTERHESPDVSTTSCAVVPAVRVTPGESRFYLSLTDELMRLFTGMATSPHGGSPPEDSALDSKIVSSAATHRQTLRAVTPSSVMNVPKYDDVLNRQRSNRGDRGRILHGDDLKEQIPASWTRC